LGTPPPPFAHVPVTVADANVQVPNGAMPSRNDGMKRKFVKKLPWPMLPRPLWTQ